MGFSDSPILSKVALAVLPVGCLFVTIGTATNNWYSYSLEQLGITQSISSGLWKGCVESICVSLKDEIPGYMKTTRAFVILSILLAVGGTVMFVIAILKNDSKPLQIIAIILPVLAALCAFIGVGIYGGEYETNVPAIIKELVKLSWSFALTAVGGCIDVVAAVLFIISFLMS